MVQGNTVLEQATDLFEAYVERKHLGQGANLVPDALREGTPVPKSWPYSRQAWEEFAEKAREHLRLKAAYDFAFAIALKGFYPDELATGQLRAGAQINAATGEVVRPPEPTISVDTEARARRALKMLADRGLSIDPILQHKLELAAYGRYTSDPKGAKAAIKVAESAINAFDAERRAAQAEADARPILTVVRPFKAKGKSYAVGRYAISREEVDELRDWREKMEAEMQQREWDAPAGYCPENWPPFVLEDAS